MWVDQWIAAGLICLAGWILLSGLDDLFIGFIFLLDRRKRLEWPAGSELDQAPERRIAIFVPLWREQDVIRPMLERNLAAIRYDNFEIFAGVYPNDPDTREAVEDVARTHGRLHVAVCPHDGPTSKGDCLNSIYRCMIDYEAAHGCRFEIVVTHDAEDLIHRDSLRLINWHSREYEMVQIPVLPIATGIGEPTHGLYCDEFAEYQTKDIPVRQRLGGFLPSNGVGTGFARDALDRLAARNCGRVFDPDCLTEDYETGYRLHALGCRQTFVPLHQPGHGPVATREYFPRNWRAAIRQRSRWVTGIALQAWQRHGWGRDAREAYWFWRDRKGILGNLLSPIANLCCYLGFVTYAWSVARSVPWHFGSHIPQRLALATLAVSVSQVVFRMWATARIYSWRFALDVPARMVWGNFVNCAATATALHRFFAARRNRGALTWSKTDHSYPSYYGAASAWPRLGEALVRLRCLSTAEVEAALQTCPPGVRLGEHLLALKKISEDDLYRALSIQSGIPLGLPEEVNRRALRELPAEAARRWRVLPYCVHVGRIDMVTPDLPSPEMLRELSIFSEREVRFRLVRPREFEALAREYLPVA
ncbi:MAG TPA: glycosyl transferase family protein [Bryobacteraceae bacterium]